MSFFRTIYCYLLPSKEASNLESREVSDTYAISPSNDPSVVPAAADIADPDEQVQLARDTAALTTESTPDVDIHEVPSTSTVNNHGVAQEFDGQQAFYDTFQATNIVDGELGEAQSLSGGQRFFGLATVRNEVNTPTSGNVGQANANMTTDAPSPSPTTLPIASTSTPRSDANTTNIRAPQTQAVAQRWRGNQEFLGGFISTNIVNGVSGGTAQSIHGKQVYRCPVVSTNLRNANDIISTPGNIGRESAFIQQGPKSAAEMPPPYHHRGY
ncbi:hypothetical protein BDN70DRAFT_893481 [Pholiota conissans]|uniref:Uncharacterized protein n=1 Tax=Pholiota conissans TaxID=109636 RepID=A0A9P6D2M0_9AGAR|nr:hypothetical protein BDN70DRAFT_893481 [Pholiota conissans]